MFSGLKAIEFIEVPINQIAKSKRKLNLESKEYLGLVESVRKSGILNPIIIRENESKFRFEVVDGACRLQAAKDVGLKTIPVRIVFNV